MFGLWKRSAPAEETEQAPGVIEMKGSEAQVRLPRRPEMPPADALRRNWRSIWPVWEEPELPAPSTLSHKRGREEVCPRAQPSVVSASMHHIPEQGSASAADNLEDSNASAALAVSPPEPSGCASDDADYYQVQVMVKIPKAAVHGPQSSAEHDAVIEKLQKQIVDMQVELQKALRALNTRSKECEDLLGVVRELTQSRSQLTAYRAVQSERFEDLQREYLRILKIVELCRAVSKENIVKTAESTKKLNQVEEELARQRLITQQTQERLASQRLINLELKERLNMLERLDLLAFRRESACMVEFQRVHLKETY